jgi:hypothetical protein
MDAGEMEIFSCLRFRTNPNPTKPGTTLRWTACYAQIAPGLIPWTCEITEKHGKCIVFNDYQKVPTTNPDINNGGKFFATAVLIHCGYSPTWPGSAACQTVFQDDWLTFISHFQVGQNGIYELVDNTL